MNFLLSLGLPPGGLVAWWPVSTSALSTFYQLSISTLSQARVLTFTCYISFNKTEGLWEFVAFFFF